jgi:hypothetical protein
MKPIPNDLYEKIERVSDIVRDRFRLKGIVIPTKNSDGSINLGRFRVENQQNGFYAVRNERNEVVVDGINLPQTAALVANDLALGKFLDNQILNKDKEYGYALFKETLYKQRIEKHNRDFSSYEISLMKGIISKKRRETYQSDIIQRFEKLRKLV